jgi:hypothetical protein
MQNYYQDFVIAKMDIMIMEQEYVCSVDLIVIVALGLYNATHVKDLLSIIMVYVNYVVKLFKNVFLVPAIIIVISANLNII